MTFRGWQRDQALENLRRAALDLILGALQMEKLLTVWAALISETLSIRLVISAPFPLLGQFPGLDPTYSIGHDDRADHAGAKVALLARSNIVLGHNGQPNVGQT